MTHSLIEWGTFIGGILLLIGIDLGINRRPSIIPPFKKSFAITLSWIILALGFAYYVYRSLGIKSALDFLNGYIVEKSLSLDNVFVFLTIFKSFNVPPSNQHQVLFWGVLGAIVFRGIFIVFGTALVFHYNWVFYIFGVFLLITSYRIALGHSSHLKVKEMPFLRFCKRYLPLTDQYYHHKFWVKLNQKWVATPLLLVLLIIEFTDVIFAFDSIPAIFAITQDSYIIFTSNIFAILGLRALYFVVANMVHHFIYLSYGLATILAFVGCKMLLHSVIPIDSLVSLGIIMTILASTIIISLMHNKN